MDDLKNLLWVASYPKTGIMDESYFNFFVYSDDGIFDLNFQKLISLKSYNI